MKLKWTDYDGRDDWFEVTGTTEFTKAVEKLLEHPAVEQVTVKLDFATAEYIR